MRSKHIIQFVGFCMATLLGASGLANVTVDLWSGVHASARPSHDQLVGLACALAAWALIAWLLAGVALTAAAAVPGALGRSGRRWMLRIAPAAIRTTLGMALGLAPVMVTPAMAASAAPTSGTEISCDAPTIGRPLGSAAEPSNTERATGDSSLADAPDDPIRSQHDRVAVQAGDSLWSIAADYLGKHANGHEIAAEWPRWFAANRDEIGPDPNVLHVGTTLTAPRS